MSAHPIFERLFADMARIGVLPPNTPPPVDLRAERIRREREASEYIAAKSEECGITPGEAAERLYGIYMPQPARRAA